MRTFVKFLMIMTCMLTSIVSVEAKDALKKIADNVYYYSIPGDVLSVNSFSVNIGIVVGKNGIAVIDSMDSAKHAKELIKVIKGISSKPIKYLINTHYHFDHSFGNSEFAKIQTIIVSHTNAKKNMEKSSEIVLKNLKGFGYTDASLKGTKIEYPSLTFNDKLDIDLGGEILQLIYMGHTHTNCGIIAYLPKEKIIFTGDILTTDFHPSLAEGDFQGWAQALDNIYSMDVDRIIPGHGPLSGKKDLTDMKEYLTLFDTKAKEFAVNSNDVKQITEEMIKVMPKRSQAAMLIQLNIQRRYVKK